MYALSCRLSYAHTSHVSRRTTGIRLASLVFPTEGEASISTPQLAKQLGINERRRPTELQASSVVEPDHDLAIGDRRLEVNDRAQAPSPEVRHPLANEKTAHG